MVTQNTQATTSAAVRKWLPYARHYNPLLIWNCSWILTVHKVRILQKKLLKNFCAFKNEVKSILTAGYNAALTVHTFKKTLFEIKNYLPYWANYSLLLSSRACSFTFLPTRSSLPVTYNLSYLFEEQGKSEGSEFHTDSKWVWVCVTPLVIWD